MSHTGENVAHWIEMECDKWGITEDVGVVTTDTAANMIKMMDYLPIHFLQESRKLITQELNRNHIFYYW